MEGIGWLLAIILGAIAGWIAEKIMKSNMGLLMNIVVGIIGAFIGGWILSLLGGDLEGSNLVVSFLTALVGACLLLFVVKAVTKRA